jgi:hypothetical protein
MSEKNYTNGELGILLIGLQTTVNDLKSDMTKLDLPQTVFSISNGTGPGTSQNFFEE